jgi:hypothetical protein
MSENDPVRLVAIGGHKHVPRLDATRFYRRHESFFELRPFVNALKCGGETRLSAAATELLNQRRPPGIVILISDFLVNTSDYEAALTQLVAAHHEVKVVHVMGESEMAGNYPPGAYRIRDAESGETREVMLGPSAAEMCRRRATDHAQRLESFCTRHALNHIQAFSAARVEETILHDFPRLGVIV